MSKESMAKRLWSGVAIDRAQPAEQKAPPPEPQDRTYKAFDTRDRAERLQIQRSAAPSRFPAYNYLLDISYDHHLQTAFSLIYTFMLVEVTGADLGPIVHAINFGNCECIREFSKKLYDQPAMGEPLIQKIVITSADELAKESLHHTKHLPEFPSVANFMKSSLMESMIS